MTASKKQAGASIARFVLCAFILFLLFRDSEASAEHMKRGLSICGETLIPTLFPFMAISELLVRSDLGSYAARALGRPMRLVFGVSGACAGALILGLLCGFPVGAKTAAALYEKGAISKADFESLMAFCNYPSAPFMIFAVGESLFGSRRIGIFLYITVLSVGILYGIAARFFKRRKSFESLPAEDITSTSKDLSFINIFADSVTSAAWSVLAVCAYVAFFTCVVGNLAALMGEYENGIAQALLFSFFELTSGSAACAALEVSSLGVILSAAAAGWSGISVFLQIYSLTRTKREAVSLLPYIQAKAVCSAACALIAALSLRIFPSLIPEKQSTADVFLPTVSYPDGFIAAVNVIFILSALICLYKKLDRRHKI